MIINNIIIILILIFCCYYITLCAWLHKHNGLSWSLSSSATQHYCQRVLRSFCLRSIILRFAQIFCIIFVLKLHKVGWGPGGYQNIWKRDIKRSVSIVTWVTCERSSILIQIQCHTIIDNLNRRYSRFTK